MTQAVLHDPETVTLLQTAFPDLSLNNIETLRQAARVCTFPANVDICREGDEGATLFILEAGRVDIIVHAEDNQEILIDSIGPGSYFGEMAFLGETTRVATIRTREDCQLLAIEEEDFMAIARTNPSLLRTLLRQIIGHIRRNDRAVINELNVKNAALSQAYADLEAQEQLRTRFIETLSHELRTPLTSIRGYLNLINKGAMKGGALQSALNSITRNVEKMVGHTNDLLILYEMHPKAPSYEHLNVPDVLIEALNVAREVMGEPDTAVTLEVAPDLPDAYADRRGLTLAVRALIENAFKYSPPQSPVAIHAYQTEAALAIAISDKGIGIAEEEQNRIFEPFQRVEKAGDAQLYPGLGVGLTIAKFVVDRHNGRIAVDSVLGQGSTFTIYLPLQ